MHASFWVFWKSVEQPEDDCELDPHLLLRVMHTSASMSLNRDFSRGPGSMLEARMISWSNFQLRKATRMFRRVLLWYRPFVR